VLYLMVEITKGSNGITGDHFGHSKLSEGILGQFLNSTNKLSVFKSVFGLFTETLKGFTKK
jgi:hypothetical protein